jgi:hypothetical protein
MGWERFSNGALLAAAAGQFDVVVTTDQNLRHQQNLSGMNIAVVVLVAKSNKLSDLRPLVPAVEAALGKIQPRSIIEVQAP